MPPVMVIPTHEHSGSGGSGGGEGGGGGGGAGGLGGVGETTSKVAKPRFCAIFSFVTTASYGEQSAQSAVRRMSRPLPPQPSAL
eukprot:3727897-Pleurochrysis_carterae.AAC.2